MATRYIETKEIQGATKQNPLVVHTWNLWVNHKNQIVCLSHSGATDRKVWVFPNEVGTIGLFNSAFNVYAYYRSKKFQNFLDKHGLTKIAKCDPNQDYVTQSHRSGWGTRNTFIVTDGDVNTERTGGDFDNYEGQLGNACYSNEYKETVTGATWVIEKSVIHYCDNHSYAVVLYTNQEDIFNLDLSDWDTQQAARI